MAVSHVKETWMESSGNLVAHINVGDNYHSRKEVWLEVVFTIPHTTLFTGML